MAQPPQPQEQEPLPFFLLTMMRTTMAAKIPATTAATRIVGQSISVTSLFFYFVLATYPRRTSIYTIKASVSAANTVPMILPPPTNHEPN